MYLKSIIEKYSPRSLNNYSSEIENLKSRLKCWASSCFLEIKDSGSRAKGTAISLASDIDYLISLSSNCNAHNDADLKNIYNSLYSHLKCHYNSVRSQNVSFRIKISKLESELEIDITPARKQLGNTNDHSIYLSKFNTWKKTNIQKHINDVSHSGRLNEIKLLKIWRELYKIDFPSIYLEYMTIDILSGKLKDEGNLSENFKFIIQQLSKDTSNPLERRIVDPANSNNILSELLSFEEKKLIIKAAGEANKQKKLEDIVW